MDMTTHIVEGSVVFDPDYYRSQAKGLTEGESARAHYNRLGWLSGLDPCKGFSTRFYLSKYPDVRMSGTNPLNHYLRFGEAEGRTPLPPSSKSLKSLKSQAKALFDADYYSARYKSELLFPQDPLYDFLAVGRLVGRWPNAEFSPTDYLFSNPDLVRNEARCGFTHYLRTGKAEGRRIRSLEIARFQKYAQLLTPYFFERFYLQQLDRSLLNFNANWLEHYIGFGWRDEHDPSPLFSSRDYLTKVPELKAGNDDPYTHYISQGRKRGLMSSLSEEPLT